MWKIILIIFTKPWASHHLQRYYPLWLLKDINKCVARGSQTNDKISIPNFTPQNSPSSFCKFLYLVKNSRTNSFTLDHFLLPRYIPTMKDDKLWKQEIIGQNWTLIDLYRRTPSTLTIKLIFRSEIIT